MRRFSLRTWLLRWLHKLLRELGMAREEFKARMGVISMNEWSDRDLFSKIGYLRWLGRQPWPVRHEHGARR